MSYSNDDRKNSKYLVATDLVARLRPDMEINELLLWAPNLFAFTSYVLSLTSSYQLVVSPPRGKKWYPKNSEIKEWLAPDKAEANIKEWLSHCVCKKWDLRKKLSAEDLVNINNLVERLKDEISGGETSQNRLSFKAVSEFNQDNNSSWAQITQDMGEIWRFRLSGINEDEYKVIENTSVTGKPVELKEKSKSMKQRREQLLNLLLKYPPASLIACWAHFYNFVVKNNIEISRLLCNHDDENLIDDAVWIATQELLTLHAVADETCVGWGFYPSNRLGGEAQKIAEIELLDKYGTLATMHSERCRVLPKRHNPDVGITLRSLSNNLAFHRSSIEVIWRQSTENDLSKKMKIASAILPQRVDSKKNEKLSQLSNNSHDKVIITALLLPYPLQVRSLDFTPFNPNQTQPVIDGIDNNFSFFEYAPPREVHIENEIEKTIIKAQEELKQHSIDILILPEGALHEAQIYSSDKGRLTLESMLCKFNSPPSVYIAGVREKPDGVTFPRNTVYCKTLVNNEGKAIGDPEKYRYFTDKKKDYRQSKHHRWKLDGQQIKQYGLSQVLSPNRQWWEAIKIPRRRVGFLNMGDRLTICPLVCEDLARQDPISDLIRHVGPTLVVTILMDGPQKKDRWSSRYATVLSEDPGCSVITLTSFGMVRRWNSPFQQMSRVVALWSEKGAPAREIELEQGASGILLTLEVSTKHEVTADGRKENYETSKVSLVDVIQVYSKE